MEHMYRWLYMKFIYLFFDYDLFTIWYWSNSEEFGIDQTLKVKGIFSFKCIKVVIILKYFSLFNLFIVEKKNAINFPTLTIEYFVLFYYYYNSP